MTELKNCPFCGSIAKRYTECTGQGHGERNEDHGVKCTNCPAKVGVDSWTQNAFERAVNAWNKRAIV